MESIYVSGPYTQGNTETNVIKAILIADALAEKGWAPFIPHLTYCWNALISHDYEFWMKQDLFWVGVTQALFRMEGFSPGAEREVALAKSLGKPVYYKLDDVPKIK